MVKYFSLVKHGEMAERFKALVLKTSDVERHRGFESLSLRQLCLSRKVGRQPHMQMYPSGSRGSPAKGVDWDNRCESSNLSICADKNLETAMFQGFFFTLQHFSTT